jgi:hypothetical protein
MNRCRTLSEEFFSRSPATQMYVKGMTIATPTSKPQQIETNNLNEYLSSSPNTKSNMISYGLISTTMLFLNKIKSNKNGA